MSTLGAQVDVEGIDADATVEEGESRMGVAQAVGRLLVAVAVMEDAGLLAERIEALLEALHPFSIRRAEDVTYGWTSTPSGACPARRR